MKKNPNNYCEFLRYEGEDLFFEEKKCKDLAEQYGTPIYCYSMNEIRKKFIKLEQSLSKFKSSIFFAVKSNYNPSIISYLANLGSGADVVSIGEIKLVLLSGIKPEKIVFSGVGKTEEEIDFAVKKNIKQINVESLEELDDIRKILNFRKKKVDISLRVNPDIDASTHQKISTGRSQDKFGIPYGQIEKIFEKFKDDKFINLNGLAIHIGSQITKEKPFEDAFKKLNNLIKILKNKNYKIDKVDLGGGIGIVYSGNNVISIENYTKIVEKNFKEFSLELLFEPGRYLVGSSGILISKVVRVKHGEKNKFLIIDCAMNDLLRPSMYDSYHEIFPVRLQTSLIESKYDVVGPICESGDNFGKNRKLQKLKKNDLIILSSVGAYGSSMSSYYNCRSPANEIIVNRQECYSSRKMISTEKLYIKK